MNLEDRFAIQEAIASYSYTWDSADPDGWANLFTDDGVWDSHRKDEVEPRTRLVGRAALREFAANLTSEDQRLGHQCRHLQTNTVFLELTTETARTHTTFLVTWLLAGEMTASILWTGFYVDEWHKTGAGWKMSHRACYLDQPA